MSKREILREFIEHVATSKEDNEDKEHRSGSSTDLNLYLLDNQGMEVGSLDDYINHITQSKRVRGHAKKFVEKYTFSEETLGDDTAIVGVTVPKKSRTDESVWIAHGEYIWVLTTVRQKWRKKTIEKLIKYLPQVERLYLSSDYLDAVTDDNVIQDSYVSGFTAKYHAPYAERKATLRFHGGRKEDLEKAEEVFDAKPTRIEFDQTNSPTAAIQGSSTNEGRLSLQSVVRGSQDKAVETLLSVSEEYQDLDKASFEVEHAPTHRSTDTGFSVDGFTAIELTNPDRDAESNESLIEELKDNVLNGNQYRFGERERDTLRVYDTHHDEIFDLAVEGPNIIVYPRETATSMSLRDIVQEIFEYDSTYSQNKVGNPVASS
ncbi:hypothetical protein [Natranaeroarchaeum aerophilus]|uniref:Uncharacterized protein n=1 Tax=Natranaeroarchaeum aerophilus TaxID=2917711 RepID=A0AAE3FQ44_9EURY|nr:hypothetical protein [Natranaeroarchaeum aerophilus]MCL9812599.1 hypothetical protein [Natranaeroarchaeum aerophilus]